MAVALPGAPFPITYRECWIAPGIKGWTGPLPSSIQDGHGLAFTGARHGTTADGVHFNGTATSNINLGAIHNAAAKFMFSVRFRLDADHINGSASKFIISKRIDANTRLALRLFTNGTLRFQYIVGGGGFSLPSVATTWKAGVWYHAFCSTGQATGGGAATDGARFRIDNGVALTDADVTAIPNGGDLVIGSEFDGAIDGMIGDIADVFIEAGIDVTDAQETDYYNGIPVATVDNAYPLDEGRGVTAYDRGADGNNGALDAAATWSFGQVEQPVISLDGINDVGISSAGVDISGDLTLVWVGKIKSTYDGLLGHHRFIRIHIGANDMLMLTYSSATNALRWTTEGSGTTVEADLVSPAIIGEYRIMIGTVTIGGQLSLFLNGNFGVSMTGAGIISGAASIAYIGRNNTASSYDPSKPLMVALIDGAFTKEQVLAYSRYLKNVFNLPIVI